MADTLVKEIQSVTQFFYIREGMDGNDVLAKNFADSLVQQINTCLSISTPDATSIIDQLKDSPYGDANIKRIVQALDAKVLGSGPPVQAGTGSSKEQAFEFPWNYCNQGDWDLFWDKHKPFHSKLTKLVERGNMCGCDLPNEQSLKWMLTMLMMAHYGDMPVANEIYDKLQELKQVVATERKTVPFQRLLVFPEKPSDLPEEVYKFAYTDGPPITVVIPGIRAAASPKFFPLRSSNKLVKKQKAANSTCAIKPEADASDLTAAPAAQQGSIDTNMPSPGDPVELALYDKYKADLWKHRAAKSGVLLAPPSNAPAFTAAQYGGSCAGGSVKHEADGSLTLTSRLGHLPDLEVKDEPLTPKPEHKPVVPKLADAAADGDSDDLDEYQKAAITALGKRNSSKKEEAAAKKRKFADVKKKPAKAGKSVKDEIVEVAKKDIMKSCPSCKGKTNPPPVHYGGGVIYTDVKRNKFRALKIRGDRYSEKSAGWSKSKPKSTAWKECIQAIDEKNAKKK